jgi:protein ImuB
VSPLAAVDRWPAWKRPARLLNRPEPISRVLALLPDAPPRRFEWRGRTHRVVAGDGPERIHGEWWRRAGEVWAVRDYFRVEDEAGGRFWLFRRGDGFDPDTGDLSWYMHGLFG